MDARGEQLKGCPFCGSDKVAIDADCGRLHFKCHCCGMRFEFSADTKTELIRKWNRRAQPLERAEAAEAEARRTTGGEVETPRRGGGVMKERWQIKCECRRLARAFADALMQLRDVEGGGNTATLDIFEYDGCNVYIQAIAGRSGVNDSVEVA